MYYNIYVHSTNIIRRTHSAVCSSCRKVFAMESFVHFGIYSRVATSATVRRYGAGGGRATAAPLRLTKLSKRFPPSKGSKRRNYYYYTRVPRLQIFVEKKIIKYRDRTGNRRPQCCTRPDLLCTTTTAVQLIYRNYLV